MKLPALPLSAIDPAGHPRAVPGLLRFCPFQETASGRILEETKRARQDKILRGPLCQAIWI